MELRGPAPLYRQIFEHFAAKISSGELAEGQRLPATRELAGSLNVNRTTISAAYDLLESEGFIRGEVGRGSFVAVRPGAPGVDWHSVLSIQQTASRRPVASARINFAGCRPPAEAFPLEDFQKTAHEVLGDERLGSVLQLGSPSGYEPLRQYLLGEAVAEGILGAADDLLITNGCQQALDLLCRVLIRPGVGVAIEDPVYSGLKTMFRNAGAKVVGVPVDSEGIDVNIASESNASILVVTPNFQNPTGVTLTLEARKNLLRMASFRAAVLIENDIYGALRYQGISLPTIKQLAPNAGTILLRSFSKIAFPGLRLGWVIGPRPLIAAMREAKQLCDLHSDQFSQAVMLRFAETGRLARHLRNTVESGRHRLNAILESCASQLPADAAFTRPQGGMSLWITLPVPLHAADLLERAQREGVSYVPGNYFEVDQHFPRSLRLSFAGLAPARIREGLTILGRIFQRQLETVPWVDEETATVFV